MTAVLCNEPFLYKPWEVGRLTPYQVRHLLLCERDKDGRVEVGGGDCRLPVSAEYLSRRRGFYLGLPPHLIDRLSNEDKQRAAAGQS